MWEPQPLATLRASTACTGIALPYLNVQIRTIRDSHRGGYEELFSVIQVGAICSNNGLHGVIYQKIELSIHICS
jgi:hypothetical protein